MFLQPDNDGFSIPVVFRSKAQCKGNGYSLGKHWNEAARHHRGALWVSLSTPMDYVAPLDKGITIACEARLAMSVDKLTEPVIIRLKEH
ncbi:hypothetical protein BMS3Bbin11_01403 [bacterium BMS3Bbin11]|nr:hypothetical protein BMS3Abin11_02184 [bacterium BMS3Abin11]GBE46303.1 hypothetical protein BMS3Bbin11_01403 [bacterium BMS3Bbin11]GMT40433.1 MAG: hypothetical protein IEMM0001_1168 [bacterium]HDZ78359.1 hypothetical protein [Gammaproteobacteria bacterium]